ncbi:1, putative isoform 1 [Cinnamomum micranthum f. kanehirae]|uniref:1, putative isoform 1 n=1 Tax=Cinnamomum micranthum f. kanehirae TaxID=337451 RepID=A0A3S3M3X9_9MAGN|nr:1, putative isoform 1 [Cinnamomum micranthum f. kanehirae]
MESSGNSSQGFMEIETGAENLDGSTVFHLIKEILGFVLYMHHQIPSVLQHLETEFDALKEECKNLESTVTEAELNATSRRKHNGRVREVKQGIKRLEKLMNAISSLLSALQNMLTEIPNIQRVVLVLGGSLVRPQHVYEIFFPHGRFVSASANECSKNKAAEALSKKAIRALISNGAGARSYAGPAKLFLLVKAPSTSNLSDHFLPKRDFKYSKKIVPFRLHINCRIHDQYMDESHPTSEASNLINLLDDSSTDMIWFQCKHSIKGLASKASLEEE